ncbi:MAG TPA: hypothetical protein VF796_09685 [Humisphaera sp.]
MPAPAVRVAAASAVWCVAHSLLASTPAKRWVERRWGQRARNAFYRPAYNALAVGSFAGLLAYIAKQPTRTLYRAPHPAAAAMRVGQAAALAVATVGAFRVGVGRFVGVPGLRAFAAGERDVPIEPEGQNPPMDRPEPRGPFAAVRHPLNALIPPLLWLNPTMTTRLAAFAAVATAYSVVGSVHTDRRLAQRYGTSFERYRKRVPLLVPGLEGWRHEQVAER